MHAAPRITQARARRRATGIVGFGLLAVATLATAPAVALTLYDVSVDAPVAKGPGGGAKATGSLKNLVVLAAFADHVERPGPTPDEPPIPAPRPLPPFDGYDVLYNGEFGVGEYFTRMSYDALTLSSTVVDWVVLPQPESYYADGVSGRSDKLHELVVDALTLVDENVDFTEFDTNGDGIIDAISILHSGFGAEFGGVDEGGTDVPGRIFSGDESVLPQDFVSSEGVAVSRYSVVSGRWGTSGTEIARIGMAAHALGHVFGLPELGDTTKPGEGTGSWCLMGNPWGFTEDQRYLPPLSAWCKIELGWVTPVDLLTPQVVKIKEIDSNPEIYRIGVGFPADEYLLIENRNETDFNAQQPGSGLAIWHIDDLAPFDTEGYPGQTKGEEEPPTWPETGKHYRVALLQADAEYNLERGQNKGDFGDLYRLGETVDRIDPDTLPSTDAYQGGIVGDTGVVIADISESKPEMEFSFGEPRNLEVVDFDGADVPDDTGAFDFGSALVGALPIQRAFTVKSTGTKALPLGTPAVPDGITVVDSLVDSLEPGDTDTLVLRMETNTQRIVDGEVAFDTQAHGKHPFNFTVTGIVTHYTPFACIETFGGWRQEAINDPADPAGVQIPDADLRVNSVTRVLSDELLTAVGEETLTNITDGTPAGNVGATQFQYVSWNSMRRDIPGMAMLPVANSAQILVFEWTVSADAETAAEDRVSASVQTPTVRLRIGEGSQLGNGQTQDILGPVGKNALVGAGQKFRSYYFVKRGGFYQTSEGFDDSILPPEWGQDDDAPVRVGLGIDILDTVTGADPFAATCGGQRDYGLTVDRIDVYSITRARLGPSTVVFNQGEPSGFALAPGEPGPPSANYAPFDLRSWDSRDGAPSGRVSFSPEERNVEGTSASSLAVNIAPGDGPVLATWDTRDFAASIHFSDDGIGMGREVVDVDNDVIVALDVWMSSPQGSVPDNLLPGAYDTASNSFSYARFGFQTEIWGGTGSGELGVDDPNIPGAPNYFRQGRAGFHIVSLSNREQYDTAYLMEPVYALQTGARRFTYFFEPQAIDATGEDALSLRPWIDFVSIPTASGDISAQNNGTINIHRVVVSTFPRPLAPRPVCP